jgi:hypothetical protein
VSEAYKTAGLGHVYRGELHGRGCRQRSKVLKALKGIATMALIDEVMWEDRLRVGEAREEEKRLRGAPRAR